MATQTTGKATGNTLATFEERIATQINEAESTIATFETEIKGKRLHAEAAAIDALKAARQTLEQKLRDLATETEPRLARAKADIDGAAAALKNALDDFARQVSAIVEKK